MVWGIEKILEKFWGTILGEFRTPDLAQTQLSQILEERFQIFRHQTLTHILDVLRVALRLHGVIYVAHLAVCWHWQISYHITTSHH